MVQKQRNRKKPLVVSTLTVIDSPILITDYVETSIKKKRKEKLRSGLTI